jgi:hypothetical protein
MNSWLMMAANTIANIAGHHRKQLGRECLIVFTLLQEAIELNIYSPQHEDDN